MSLNYQRTLKSTAQNQPASHTFPRFNPSQKLLLQEIFSQIQQVSEAPRSEAEALEEQQEKGTAAAGDTMALNFGSLRKKRDSAGLQQITHIPTFSKYAKIIFINIAGLTNHKR